MAVSRRVARLLTKTPGLVALCLLAIAAACGLEGSGANIDGTATDDGGGSDATPKGEGGVSFEGGLPEIDGAAEQDAGPDVTFAEADGSCGSRWSCPQKLGLTCVDDCRQCPAMAGGRTLACLGARSCVSNCAQCASGTIECYSCESTGGLPVGTCESTDGTCMRGEYPHCPCSTQDGTSGDVSACPGGSQVCAGAGFDRRCMTCGEKQSKDQTCKQGGQCDSDERACQ